MKNYIGFSNDHSGSMSGIGRYAAKDFNTNISAIQQAARMNNLDTIVSVIQCGLRLPSGSTGVKRQIVNSNIHIIKPIAVNEYATTGGSTPLFDSVGELIDLLQSVPDANDPDVSFLIIVTTDGGENSSKKWTGVSLSNKIRELQNTDRWTFVFRVPRGETRNLTRFGIPSGNIQEWDQTAHGVTVSTQATTAAFNDYYTERSRGVKSTSTFYASAANVTVAEAKAQLKDISAEITMWPVLHNENGAEIRPFVEKRLNKPMLKGSAFYLLNKTESKVQENKLIIIRDSKDGTVYYGPAARQMIGLPTVGNARVVPGAHGNWEIYIQSTSVNRKLVTGSCVMYWPHVGKAFTEGPSYQPKAVVAAQAAAVAPVVQAHSPAIAQVLSPITIPGKIRLLRKKDGVFVKEVDSISEAIQEIEKAKRGKKATLIYMV